VVSEPGDAEDGHLRNLGGDGEVPQPLEEKQTLRLKLPLAGAGRVVRKIHTDLSGHIIEPIALLTIHCDNGTGGLPCS
jgi:hypothetical protein